jgi:hypothetical protein
MNKQDIIHALNDLSEVRPVFHSEADFHHSLANIFASNGFNCRLEKPYSIMVNGEEIRVELDILVVENGQNETAIELKYVKKRYAGIHSDEHFDLAESWSTNLSRFDCFADFQRVSALVNAGKATKGFCIFLTNKENAWNHDVTASGNLGSQFSIHEGRVLVAGEILNWIGNPHEGNVGTKRLPPYCPIEINQNVELKWIDYSKSGTSFRYLLLEYQSDKEKANLQQPHVIQNESETTHMNQNSEKEKNNDSGLCLQCLLGETIIKKHRLSGLNLPIINDNTTVQHNGGHRIVCSTREGWTYQYHVNQKSVRIDRFASDEEIYDQFFENHGVLNGDFGNGIEGNETRSIRKLTLEGANAKVENFDRIAEESVQIMSEIYCL